jgi:hypothetical protein
MDSEVMPPRRALIAKIMLMIKTARPVWGMSAKKTISTLSPHETMQKAM